MVFDAGPSDWPFPGYPAWVVIEAVDMPLVKMGWRGGGGSQWVNANLIKTISVV